MDTKQMPLGTKLFSVVRVTPAIFHAHSSQFLYMFQDYFKRSSDKSSDPIASFNSIRERLSVDDKFMLLAPMEHDIPVGFLAADVIGDTARILLGYVHNAVRAKVKNMIIEDVLATFDEWAKDRGCKASIFYTYRAPNAHRLMIKRGWSYEMSMYRKEA